MQRRLQDEELAGVLGRMRLLGERLHRGGQPGGGARPGGHGGGIYFGQFGKLLLSDELTFTGRNRRPPRDPINACLSFGYYLLGTVVKAEVLHCGLEPLVGFFSSAASGPVVADAGRARGASSVSSMPWGLRLVNRQQLGPVDFERRGGVELAELLAAETGDETGAEGGGDAVEGVYLAEAGRRVFLTEFYRHLRGAVVLSAAAGVLRGTRNVMREQVYHLARVIRGEDEEDWRSCRAEGGGHVRGGLLRCGVRPAAARLLRRLKGFLPHVQERLRGRTERHPPGGTASAGRSSISSTRRRTRVRICISSAVAASRRPRFWEPACTVEAQRRR